MRASVAINAFVAAIVGFGGTLALIIAAANALGADHSQTASWVSAICIAMALETAYLSWRTRMPVITAWSTPGAALIAASTGFSMAEGVGAFLIAGLLLLLSGIVTPLTRAIAAIPMPVASGMLAGVIIVIVTGGLKAAGADPVLLVPLAALFLAARLWNPSLAVLAVLAIGALAAFAMGRAGPLPVPEMSELVLTWPEFTWPALFGLALPLWLVTMASQNLSGLAVLRAAGYHPAPGLLIGVTGLFSVLTAPFNAHTTNLAAISAAICTGPDTHPDPAKRWLTGPFYAAAYLVFAVFGASLVALFAALPPGLIALVAALALLPALANAFTIALSAEQERFAAIVAFSVTASGIVLASVGSAFWGLLAGLIVLGLEHFKKTK